MIRNVVRKAASLALAVTLSCGAAAMPAALARGEDVSQSIRIEAENGDVDKMMDLAMMYSFSDDAAEQAEAFYWFQQAAEHGSKDAVYKVAECYRDGLGVEQNDVEAVNWFAMSVSMGDPDAMLELGVMMYLGKGTEMDKPQAHKWIERSAELGVVDAMRINASIYERGVYTEADPEKALLWYQRASEHGDEKSVLKLVDMYSQGDPAIRSEEQTFRWLLEAALLGQADAVTRLVDCYLNGEGVKPDLGEACFWALYAREEGIEGADTRLAEVIERVNEDDSPMLGDPAITVVAANDENPSSDFSYHSMQMISNGQYERAARMWVDAGYPDAVYQLGNALYYGTDGMTWIRLGNAAIVTGGVESNLLMAVRMFKLAAEAGVPDAMADYGQCLINGTGGVMMQSVGVHWYEEAWLHGSITGANRLGLLLMRGECVEQDYSLAVQLFQEAVDGGDPDAMCSLALCYMEGAGVEADLAQAVDLYRRSAEAGFHTGMLMMGEFCMFGVGMEQDFDMAMDWLQQAYDLGDMRSAYWMALAYCNGWGVEADIEHARELYHASERALDVDYYGLAELLAE